MNAGTQGGAGAGWASSPTPGDPLERYPAYLSRPTPSDPLSRYPAYLSTPAPPVERTRSPLVSALGAYAAAFVAQMLAAIPIGLFIVGGFAPSVSSTSADIHRAAALAALFAITTLVVVAVAAAWLFLRLRGVQPAFVIGFLGQVVAFVLGALGARLVGEASLVLGVLGGVGTTYALIVWLKRSPTE